MTKAGRPARPARVRLPEELTGAFTGVIIGTFGAELEFAELQFFRQLPKSVVNSVVLADQRQLRQFLSAQPSLRRLNRAYVASPVLSPHAHHSKYLMLVGADEGRLFVGSGNLSIGGYAGPGECFTSHEWHADDAGADPTPFGAVRELIETMSGSGWIDAVTQERIRDIFKAAPWVPTTGGENCVVVHNQSKSLLDQLSERVGNSGVLEIVAAAPFHDKSAEAIKQIIGRFAPERFQLLVQEGATRLNVEALKKVLSGVKHVEILEASAPHPYPAILLHAKFLLVRTKSADLLLQGSANLSKVALCESGQAANVEIANLLRGPRGEFDSLLESLDLNPRPAGLSAFNADTEWSDTTEASSISGPSNVTWSPPTLRGELPASLEMRIGVHIDDMPVNPASTLWDQIEDTHHFSFDFSDADAARIDVARHIVLTDSSDNSWTVYPYHLHSLVRLTASGSRADLLQQAGDLDLSDKELEDLVAELERVLIVDGRSLWRLANPEASQPETDTDSEVPILRYGDLDWSKLGTLPQLRQYGSAVHRSLLAPTELGLLLQSLTNRFRAEAGTAMVTDIGDDAFGDLGEEPESEDPDVLDASSEHDDEDEPGSRQIVPRQRVRRLWRNFIKRFIQGLSDEEFIRSVGSPVVIPSYVVFNHLCRRLRNLDLVDSYFLTDAQITLWSFMWGANGRGGYLANLPSDELAVARKILFDRHDLPLTLAAIDDAWCHVWDGEMNAAGLRAVWRNFLESNLWDPEPEALKMAAQVATGCDGSVDDLFDDLYALAAHVEDGELPRMLAGCLGVSTFQVREMHDTVVRSGVRAQCRYFKVDDFVLSQEVAGPALALWNEIEPETDYLRIESENATAVIDLKTNDGFFFDRREDLDVPLTLGERLVPSWEVRLEQLFEAA